ncbi:unnamed protein product [Sphagnum balticum]
MYCLEDKYFTSRKNSGSEFNKDHVIPESFGSFVQGMTLIGMVCSACNESFGKDLESALSREGAHGYLRLKHGHKAPSELSDFKAATLPMRIVSDDDLVNGAEIRLDNYSQSVTHRPKEIVGFRDSTGRILRLTEEQLQALPNLKDLALVLPFSIIMFLPTDDERERVKKLLAEKGAQMEKWHDIPVGSYAGKGVGELDRRQLRAICKIAYNYFAFVYEGIFPGIALSSDFDAVREFIRSDKNSEFQLIAATAPIEAVHNDKRLRDQEGHAIAVGFTEMQRHKAVFAQVSLYNIGTLGVVLSPSYRQLLLPAVGHFLSFEDNKRHQINVLSLVPASD